MSNYIAYVDLLGVKELARFDVEGFKAAMDDFQKYLIWASSAFYGSDPKRNSIYGFSDSALIESDNLENLLTLLTTFRDELFCAGYYFTAVVDKGYLEPVVYKNHISESSTHNLYRESGKYFHGSVFLSQDVSRLYNQFSYFKGIGISLSRDVTKDEIKKHETTPSHFLSSHDRGRIETYTDIQFEKDSITKDFFQMAMERYTLSNTKSTKFGIYYISLICTLINSFNYSGITMSSPSPQKIANIAALFSGDTQAIDMVKAILTIKDDYKELFLKAKHIEIIYLCLLNKLYSDRGKVDAITRNILRTIIKIPRVKSYFGIFNTIPESIISHSSYNMMMQDYMGIIKERIASSEER